MIQIGHQTGIYYRYLIAPLGGNELLTVQTLAALGLGGAALPDDALSWWTLQAALAAAGVLAGLARELHRPLGL